MKRLMILIAVLLSVSATCVYAKVTPEDYTVYTFEDGLPQDMNITGGAKTAVTSGHGGSKGAMVVTLATSAESGNYANGSVQLPVYLAKGTEYKISFYYKPQQGGSITRVRPLVYDADGGYKFLEEDMSLADNGWYYYSTLFTPDQVSAGGGVSRDHVDGIGTIELRMTRNEDDNSVYMIDDVVVEPADKVGYQEILVDEDFNGGMGAFEAYDSKTTASIETRTDDGSDKYVKVTGTTANTGIKNKTAYRIALAKDTEYELSFDVIGLDEQTNGKKVMWLLRSGTYFVNEDSVSVVKDTWTSYSRKFKLSSDLSDQYIFPKLSSNAGLNGTYGLDNIVLKRVLPQIDSVEVSGNFAVGDTLNAEVTADTGLRYLYKVVLVDDDNNTSVKKFSMTSPITYTFSPDDAGKRVMLEVTAYDETYVYNTVSYLSEVTVLPVAEMMFTTPFEGSVSASICLNAMYDSSVVFLAAYTADNRLCKVLKEDIFKGQEKVLTMDNIPSEACELKLVMVDNINDLNAVTNAVILERGTDND